mgnify:FL=1
MLVMGKAGGKCSKIFVRIVRMERKIEDTLTRIWGEGGTTFPEECESGRLACFWQQIQKLESSLQHRFSPVLTHELRIVFAI